VSRNRSRVDAMHATRSITSTSTVRQGGLSTSTMGSCSRVGQNGGDNPAAAKSIDLRKRPIRRLGSSDCSSRCQSGSRAMTRHTKYIVVQPVFESIVGTQYSD
jgi:uncharacterized protein YlaI